MRDRTQSEGRLRRSTSCPQCYTKNHRRNKLEQGRGSSRTVSTLADGCQGYGAKTNDLTVVNEIAWLL